MGNIFIFLLAWQDTKVLSKEYHMLVMKYHPDNNPDGIAVFIDIQREREEILKQFAAS